MAGQQQRGRRPQAQQTEDRNVATVASVQEGSKWRFSPPSGEEVAAWFRENVQLHDGMDPERYVGGVVLIPANEKVKLTIAKQGGGHMQMERWDQTYTPYSKVETRVAYFWDYMALNPDWMGVIEPVPVKKLDEQGYRNQHLPRGFFKIPVKQGRGDEWVDYLGCSMRVRVFDRNNLRIELRDDPDTGEPIPFYIGPPILDAPPASKMVATLKNATETDPFAIMKAETGAIGRALGMAGMLVIPGSGVATAEDMVEAAAQGGDSSSGAITAALPDAPQEAAAPADGAPADGAPADGAPPAEGPADDQQTGDDQLRARIGELTEKLAPHEEQMDRFRAWAVEKKIDFDDLKEHQLRGALRKLEQLLEEIPASE